MKNLDWTLDWTGLDWTGLDWFFKGGNFFFEGGGVVFFFLASSLPCMAIQCGSLNMYISPILVF